MPGKAGVYQDKCESTPNLIDKSVSNFVFVFVFFSTESFTVDGFSTEIGSVIPHLVQTLPFESAGGIHFC